MAQAPQVVAKASLPKDIQDVVRDVNTALSKLYVLLNDVMDRNALATPIAVADGGTGSTTAADARVALDLEPGVDVQAYDAELAAIAGLTSAADRLPYFTGLGTAALATFTSAGRDLLDDANAAAQRTTLGAVGTGAITTSGLTQATARMLGRTTASTGAIEEITVGSNLSLSAGSLNFATEPAPTRLAVQTYFYIYDAVDPSDPGEGQVVFWLSTIGDLKVKITYGGVTKTATLADFSAL
jgi:hypothetical protein